ncbi:MAG: SPOR domain-containing protein [Candidatus Omnitrophota bacterium]
MERNNAQLELFSQDRNGGFEKKAASGGLLTYIRGYEKIILILIGFIITAVVSFCLGVEKGRRLAVRNADSQLDMAVVQPVPQIPARTVSQKLIQPRPEIQAGNIRPIQTQDNMIKPIKNQDMGSYTIQIAAYQTRANAQKEAEILKKKGVVSVGVI